MARAWGSQWEALFRLFYIHGFEAAETVGTEPGWVSLPGQKSQQAFPLGVLGGRRYGPQMLQAAFLASSIMPRSVSSSPCPGCPPPSSVDGGGLPAGR